MMKTTKIKSLAAVAAVVTLALVLATGGWARAGEIGARLTETMASTAPDEAMPVIIRLNNTVDVETGHASQKAASRLSALLKDNAHTSQGLLRATLRAKGIQEMLSLWIINGIAVRLTPEQILEFAGHPDVASIVLDDTIYAPIDPETELTMSSGSAWDNLGAIQAPAMRAAGIDGSGVVVATMDSGVDADHPDLTASWRGGGNSWFDPHGEHSTPYDSTGHGTAVMGVLAGGSAIGVAPGAKWIAVKLFSDSGTASYSDIHLGYQWLLDPDGLPDTADAPHVINNSWGLSGAEGQCITEFQQDVQTLKAAGIAMVFSGGNGGPYASSNTSPANYPESFAVGAVDQTGTIAVFSGRGPSACGGLFPEVSAPGVDVNTANKYGGYGAVTGTSIAAPHAAGAMALLKDAYPGAPVVEMEDALMQSAVDLGEPLEDNASGYGLVQAAAAGTFLSNPPGCADSDNDGYFSTDGCGTLEDCDDDNVDRNPSASDIKNDGIDQNCNGYDLTIDIVSAVYLAADQKLTVEATSDLGKDAALELVGYGSMGWNRKKSLWSISVRNVPQDPGNIAVGGVEGYTASATTLDAGGGGSGGGGNYGKGKKK
ncbi:S8 family serine peptidase [Desulfosarcina ovata]|uniref:Peptidase S8/S53 domain-containing protein n=1 Tax=Desulfosarcina ovata subsp. ovata TaxID=2752305 RepID=A0A5K8AIZ6_9BACT|nr:S8 family serine peptidase [Desulfosarcina ovata]BBO92665.1 hypothetical protein DSCOOX_58450 [Desulfosarcina ovata subsp. ovata]